MNKRHQIQLLVDQSSPDLLYISEANLDELTPVYECIIEGYTIIKPKTITRNNTSRLVLLAKDSLDITVMDRLMDDICTTIWVKVSRPGVKSILSCGTYREHQYLNQATDWSLQPQEQVQRWNAFLRQVETARISNTCHLIGDYNLDYCRWDVPSQGQAQID